VLDGFAATAKIRELENNGTIHGRLPIIALTANVSTESEEKCRAAGMDHFLPKPFKMNGTLPDAPSLTHPHHRP
jgi:CheY-like chemotaxis protein